ncbi:MAG: hypothetical protein IJW16_08410 [Clostridia bacterium]|nr:hypothetical protein [Clostridia bacterium]
MKKTVVMKRMMSILMVLCMLVPLAAQPVASLVSGVIEAIESRQPAGMQLSGTGDPYSSFDDIKIPEVKENPYDVNVNVEYYPIYNSYLYKNLYDKGFITGYGTWDEEAEGRSPYFTASINPWHYARVTSGGNSSNDLPYREMMGEGQLDLSRDTLYAGTTLNNGAIMVSERYQENAAQNYAGLDYSDRPEFDYRNIPFIDESQTFLRAGATVLSGYGCIQKSFTDDDEVGENAASVWVWDSKPVQLTLNCKLNELDLYELPYFRTDNGSMMGMHYTLIDDTAPTAQHITVIEDEENQELILKVEFNEGIRWNNSAAWAYLDKVYLDVELRDLRTNKTSTLRAYIAELGGGEKRNLLTFRGALGDYIYKDFRVERIVEAHFNKGVYSTIRIGVVDMVDAMYTDAYNGTYYGNKIHSYDGFAGFTSILTDFAGNGINTGSMTNWKFTETFINNTFEAIEVMVYNDITIGKLEEEQKVPTEWPKDIDRTHLFSGEGNTLIFHVNVNTKLTEEEARKVSAVLNVNDRNGDPLTVPCTSSYTFVPTSEVYGNYNSKTVTCLIFEIKLEAGMQMNVAAGVDPQLAITTLTDTIEDKDAWYQVVAPSRQMYGDFDAPTVAVERKSPAPTEPNADGNYTLMAEIIVAENIVNEHFYAGTQGSTADIFIGGGVLKPTKIKYALTKTAETPAASEFAEATVPLNGTVHLKSLPLISNHQVYYLHVLVPSGNVMIDDLCLGVRATDLVGNATAINPPLTIDYRVDEIAPNIEYIGEKMTASYNSALEQIDIKATVTLNITDYNSVASVRYCWLAPDETPNDETVWMPLEIDDTNDVVARISKDYENVTEDVYEVLWVRATDQNGNESAPVSRYVNVSTAKPSTNVEVSGNLYLPSTHPSFTVIGPDASQDASPVNGYTRVTLAPINSSLDWEYVTVVGTGEEVDLFSFDRRWYKVTRSGKWYETVEAIDGIDSNFVLAEGHGFYDLFTYYGELKVSFENGYESMIPVAQSYVYSAPRAGSYIADPNYYTLYFASYSTENTPVHKVDFGKFTDAEGNVKVADAEQTADAILFNAVKRGENPMQNMQIHFSLSNLLRNDWGMTDIDMAASTVELHRIDKNDQDTVVAITQGLSGADTQFYSIPARRDDGGYLETGLYYVKVNVRAYSGRVDSYSSFSMVLDADTVENDGLWSYSYQTNYNISGSYNFDNEKNAIDAPFASMGISVSVPGEVMRSNLFAVYSSGVSGYSLVLGADQNAKEFAGFTVGMVEGYRIWNKGSNPTDEEIAAQPFRIEGTTNSPDQIRASYAITQGVDSIYDADSIPKGAAGFKELYLMKGVNTICYQVKMENGYISPVRQFTVIVTDYIPTLNMAVENYTPSHNASDHDAITNIHDLTLFVESAYSLNGTGDVAVEIWGRYDMEVNGQMAYDPNHDIVTNHLEKLEWENGEVVDLGVNDTVVLTENSYTGEFPVDVASICTAVFVAIDEYGGITVVAPQLGDHRRYDNTNVELDPWSTFESLGREHSVPTASFDIYWDGGYHDDPYVVGRNAIELRTFYNQPVQSGKDLVAFENVFSYMNGEEQVLMTSLPDLEYNLFNVSTNRVDFGGGKRIEGRFGAVTGYRYENGKNFDLINWESSTITFSGGDLAQAVTVKLAGGEANAAGYVEGGYYNGAFSFTVANPRSTNVEQVGETVTRSFVIRGYNIYDDPFEYSGTITLTYTGQSSIDFVLEDVDTDALDLSSDTLKLYDGRTDTEITTPYSFAVGTDAFGEPMLRIFLYADASNPIGSLYGESSGGVKSVKFLWEAPYKDGSGTYSTGKVTEDEVKCVDPNLLVCGDDKSDNQGALIHLSFETLEHSNEIGTDIYDGSIYSAQLTDYYGNKVTVTHDISNAGTIDAGTQVTFSSPGLTSGDLTVTIKREDGTPIYVEISDYAYMSVENNNTAEVTVTLTKNLSFCYYHEAGGKKNTVTVIVDRIVQPDPKLVWSYDSNDVRVDNDGVYYVYGAVTVYLTDQNFKLTDYTGKTPSFTFYPGAENAYRFHAADITATLGTQTPIALAEDIVAELLYAPDPNFPQYKVALEVRERPDPLGFYDEQGNRVEDTEPASLQLLAYTNQGGYYVNEKLALQLESAKAAGIMTDYAGYTVFESAGHRGDSTALLQALGWSSGYRFEIEISDMSRTKLFIKDGLYADVPDFETGYSDVIPGVTLNSRLLDVTRNAKFTLFVVDKYNNAVSIPFEVTEVGSHPLPTVTKVPLDNTTVRIYVDAPVTDPASDVDDFTVESPDLGIEAVKVNDTQWYVDYKANDEFLINYSYTYKGEPVSGTVDAYIREIDDRDVELRSLEWSANKQLTSTGVDVSVSITFSEEITAVLPSKTLDAGKVTYKISGNTVTVTYKDNYEAISLRCTAIDCSSIRVDLDNVDNIDRTAPVLVAKTEPAADGKTVLITITSNEPAIFREGGYVGELKNGLYYYYRTVTANGSYTYHFTDLGGTMASVTVVIDAIVDGALNAQYSTSMNGTDPVNDPAELELSIGDYVYVKPARDVVAQFNGGADIRLSADTWTKLEITSDTGGKHPFIVMEDQYGNTLTHQFSKISIPDGTPPEIVIIKHVFTTPINTDRAELEALLLQNFQAFDDDGELTLTVTFTNDLTVSGITAVEYTARDSAGNVGRASGKLRITVGEEPWVCVNGEQIDRDGSAFLTVGEDATLTVDVQGRTYSVSIKAGIKTVAQMKIGSTNLVSGAAGTDPIDLGELARGYHTLCVLTQDRDYFKIILYVE